MPWDQINYIFIHQAILGRDVGWDIIWHFYPRLTSLSKDITKNLEGTEQFKLDKNWCYFFLFALKSEYGL